MTTPVKIGRTEMPAVLIREHGCNLRVELKPVTREQYHEAVKFLGGRHRIFANVYLPLSNIPDIPDATRTRLKASGAQ